VESKSRETWETRHQSLLDAAKELKSQPVVDRVEVLQLQREIRELERRIDRPLPPGTVALRVFPSLQNPEFPGRAPVFLEPRHSGRRCAFGSCDGSGWHLEETEDVAHPCRCQRLPRDREARRQSKRVLRRHLALGLNAPPLSDLEPLALQAIADYGADLLGSIKAGSGLWLTGASERTSPACAFLTGEAMRREVPVLMYPGDELIGRLRRIAAGGDRKGGLEHEIYERLASVDLLVLDGLDAPAAPQRFPEPLFGCNAVQSPENDPHPTANDEGEPYRPGMSETDLARVFQILDERLARERATVISTVSGRHQLEDDLLHLPGAWHEVQGSGWGEPQRRAVELRRLISRLSQLCGQPLCT
jgi:hypothetical protein